MATAIYAQTRRRSAGGAFFRFEPLDHPLQMVELRVRIAPLARRELERRLRCKDEIILRRGRGRPPSEVFQRGTSTGTEPPLRA